MRVRNIEAMVLLILTALIYISVSDCFGLIDFSIIVVGEFYDYLFILALVTIFAYVFFRRKILRLKAYNVVLWPYILLTIIACIQLYNLHSNHTQTIRDSFSVIRELLLLWIIVLFGNINYDEKKIVKGLILLDVIAVIIYITEVLSGGPLFGNPYHSQGIYEALGGIRIWRCWVDSPAFICFSFPYLLINFINKETVFSTKSQDYICFMVLLIGEIVRLGRTELISVLLAVIVAYYCCDKLTLYQFLKKAAFIIASLGVLLIVIYFAANEIFQRFYNGLVAIINISDETYRSTLSVRASALSLRVDYILKQSKAFFGLGPLHRNYPLIFDVSNVANKGVLCSDSAYATFLLRYGFIGTGLYMLGCILNFFLLKGKKTFLTISVAAYMLAILVMGISGYDAMGKQALLKVGMLLGICVREELNMKYRNSISHTSPILQHLETQNMP